LCGRICDLASRRGCQRFCSKPSNHEDEEHRCSVKYHQCGSVRCDYYIGHSLKRRVSFRCAIFKMRAQLQGSDGAVPNLAPYLCKIRDRSFIILLNHFPIRLVTTCTRDMPAKTGFPALSNANSVNVIVLSGTISMD
jgi:hypothetical protein